MTGFDGATCVFAGTGLFPPVCDGQILPASVHRRFNRAHVQIELARFAAGRREAKRFLHRASKGLASARKPVERAAITRRLTRECETTIVRLLVNAARRTRDLAKQL